MPSPVVRWLRCRCRRRAFSGCYGTWAEAQAVSQGYAHKDVLERVVATTRAVAAGHGTWDRDGAVFPTPEVNGPLLIALRRIADTEHGQLDLVDFGGALGSTWRQHRNALGPVLKVRWRVVEQPHYVEAGQEFADGVLSFHRTVGEAMAESRVSTILLSSVLPYLEHPRELLAEVSAKGIRHVIIDRTSFAVDRRERIVVQRVPPELGGGSYPCWLFNREALLAPLAAHYRLVSEWPGFDDVDRKAIFRGFHFVRK